MRGHNKCKRGFTLIELIVVIAILAILATIGIISYANYIESSKESVCETNIMDLNRMLEYEKTAGSYITVAQENFQSIALSVYPVARLEDGGVVGLCPDGGVYKLVATSFLFGDYCIECSVHGSYETMMQTGIKNLIASDKVLKYFKNTSAGKHLDSEANFSTATAPTVVNQLAKELGLDMSNYSWRIEQKSKTAAENDFDFVWSSENISSLNVGDTIEVVKYNSKTETYEHGTAKVGTHTECGSTYNVINISSFVASEK